MVYGKCQINKVFSFKINQSFLKVSELLKMLISTGKYNSVYYQAALVLNKTKKKVLSLFTVSTALLSYCNVLYDLTVLSPVQTETKSTFMVNACAK